MRFLRGTATSGAFFSPRIKGQKLPSRRGFARDKAGGVFFICFVLFCFPAKSEREHVRVRCFEGLAVTFPCLPKIKKSLLIAVTAALLLLF